MTMSEDQSERQMIATRVVLAIFEMTSVTDGKHSKTVTPEWIEENRAYIRAITQEAQSLFSDDREAVLYLRNIRNKAFDALGLLSGAPGLTKTPRNEWRGQSQISRFDYLEEITRQFASKYANTNHE